jgi:hypothetical protein
MITFSSQLPQYAENLRVAQKNGPVPNKGIASFQLNKNLSQECVEKDIETKSLALLRAKPFMYFQKHQQDHLFHTIVHIALKGYQDREVRALQLRYGVAHITHHAFCKLEAVQSLVEQIFQFKHPQMGISTQQEKLGLLRIFQHRHNFFYYTKMLLFSNASSPQQVEAIIDKILLDIKALEDPHSSQIICLENGATCFIFPGGWSGKKNSTGHYVNFEFRKDAKGHYFFIIHNRGEGSNNQKLHGSLSFKKEGKTYSRTCTPIQTFKQALQNRPFLSLLVRASLEDKTLSGDMLYEFIYAYFIERNRGSIIQSIYEQKAQALLHFCDIEDIDPVLRKKATEVAEQLLDFDPNFHSQQLFATCAESSTTPAEKNMAPASVQRALKSHTLSLLLQKIKQQYLMPSPILKHLTAAEIIWKLKFRLKHNLLWLNYVEGLEKMLQRLEDLEKQIIKNKKIIPGKHRTIDKIQSELDLTVTMIGDVKQNIKKQEKVLKDAARSIANIKRKEAILNQLQMCMQNIYASKNALSAFLISNCQIQLKALIYNIQKSARIDCTYSYTKLTSQMQLLLTLTMDVSRLKLEILVHAELLDQLAAKDELSNSIKNQFHHLKTLLKGFHYLQPLLRGLEFYLIENREAKIFQIHIEKQIKKLNSKLKNPPQKNIDKMINAVRELRLEFAKLIEV